MGASVGNKKGFVAEINVTPFVDVMLVLLIIFMVTAPMMNQGIEVDLPQTKQVESLPTDTDHLVLTVRRDGQLFLDTYNVPLEELEERVKVLITDKNRALFLQADTHVPYGVIVDVMGRVKSAGVEQLGVVATASDINADDLAKEHAENSPTTEEAVTEAVKP